MWRTISDFIMTWLDPIGVVLGLLVSLPVFWTWYEVVFGERRRRRRWFREVRSRPGERPAILILDLLPGRDILPSVERFRNRMEPLRGIPEERVFRITRTAPLRPEDMPQLHEEIRRVAGRILASGTDRLHYFHAGPAIAAALVGTEFANALPVLLYQHHGDGYENYGPAKLAP